MAYHFKLALALLVGGIAGALTIPFGVWIQAHPQTVGIAMACILAGLAALSLIWTGIERRRAQRVSDAQWSRQMEEAQ